MDKKDTMQKKIALSISDYMNCSSTDDEKNYLYRYISVCDDEKCDYAFKNLQDDTVQFSPVLCFNDPFDGTASITRTSNVFYGIDKRIEDIVTETIRKYTLIACFTQQKDNYLMWAHYAKSYSGICVAYNKQDVFNAVNNIGGYIGNITYSKKRPSFNGKYPESPEEAAELIKFFTYKKADLWSYEQEIRAICKPTKYDGKGNPIRRSVIIPARKVYLGIKISSDVCKRYKKVCDEKNIEAYSVKTTGFG